MRLPIIQPSYYFSRGIQDIVDGAQQWRLCYLLGSADMRRRYARSKLGPIWIMISSAIMISTMGLVWSRLWGQPIRDMLPYVAVGMVTWQLVAGVLTEATMLMQSNAHYFLNQYVPASAVIFSLLYRQAVIFGLNILFPLAIAIALGSPVGFSMLLSLLGMILLSIACFWMAYVLAIFCTRFRDIAQLVNSALQVAIFLTPVLWKPELLSGRTQELIMLNPFTSLIAIVRDPLLGRPVPVSYWICAAAISLGGLVIALPFIGRFRRRLIYWL